MKILDLVVRKSWDLRVVTGLELLGPLGRYINLEGARVWAPWDAKRKGPKAGPLGTEVDGIFQEKKSSIFPKLNEPS